MTLAVDSSMEAGMIFAKRVTLSTTATIRIAITAPSIF